MKNLVDNMPARVFTEDMETNRSHTEAGELFEGSLVISTVTGRIKEVATVEFTTPGRVNVRFVGGGSMGVNVAHMVEVVA